jgi:predicted HAD superfamily Cof-like phosphohydrolase
MEKQVQQVLEFYKAFKHPIATSPKFIPIERVIMRHRLLDEEVVELFEAGSNGDIVDVADAIADCFYILIGTAIEYGIAEKLPALFDEVHRSNMSKLDDDGKPIYREDGKVLKSNNYTPPNLKDIVWNSIQK